MNNGMKAGVALLVRLPFAIFLLWLFGLATGDRHFAIVFAGVAISLTITILLSSWFGLLIKRRPAFASILKYYILSSALGVLLQGSLFLSIVIGAKGIQAVPSEFVQLRNESGENPDLWIVFSVILAIFLLFTTVAVFERDRNESQ